jgi:predicted choloylglycine hydrolase
MSEKRRFVKTRRTLIVLTILIVGFVLYYREAVKMTPPDFNDTKLFLIETKQLDDNLYVYKDNWLNKNKYGLWELMVGGTPEELGAVNGALTEELAEYQEYAFVERIKEMIPSEGYLNFLKYFTSWFNRNMDEYIPEEYLKEIYGVSQFASDKYDFIGDNYDRILNYHAAHDIGHALQNLSLVGCTSFGVKGEYTKDGKMLIGRNFDFYSGDRFAENKIVTFMKPESGHNFVSITWGGLIGVVSGMNDKGLTITLNSAKSDIPMSARTPVSIVARKILQYASTIDEAYEIAKGHRTFVSETFLIGSARDGNTMLIEKSPDTTVLYQTGEDYIIATNHFQHKAFENDELNITNIDESASMYRFKRVDELIDEKRPFAKEEVASLLRDEKGIGNENIGLGNEKAVNQLIAHHSIIFKPQELKVWISTAPYQLGNFVMYDLNKVFADTVKAERGMVIYNESEGIDADNFLSTEDYKNFVTYKSLHTYIKKAVKGQKTVQQDTLFMFRDSNTKFFETWNVLGDYYASVNDKDKSETCYRNALTLEIPKHAEREAIQDKIVILTEEE